jgi:hypothetical protein
MIEQGRVDVSTSGLAILQAGHVLDIDEVAGAVDHRDCAGRAVSMPRISGAAFMSTLRFFGYYLLDFPTPPSHRAVSSKTIQFSGNRDTCVR